MVRSMLKPVGGSYGIGLGGELSARMVATERHSPGEIRPMVVNGNAGVVGGGRSIEGIDGRVIGRVPSNEPHLHIRSILNQIPRHVVAIDGDG